MIPTATLTVSLTGTDSTTNETYSLGTTKTLTSMSASDKRMMTLDTTSRTIMAFGANVAAGTFTGVSGILIINRSTTATITLGRVVSGGDSIYEKLEPGKFVFINSRSIEGTVSAAPAWSAWADMTSIVGNTDSGTAVIEYMILHA